MTHAEYMKRALRLAARGRTSPNPMVGAVVVRNGEIVGEGYHCRAGEPHAEVLALRQSGESARGATMYVTLEPCCHYGRTPPCTKAIIEAGISDLHAAMLDPDPKVAGKGFAGLGKAGIVVHCPLLEDEARCLNEAYIKHRTTGMPFVILKSAMSLDGRIATRTGDSKWITNERSRAFAHRIRSRVDAVVVGASTARVDDPRLTARLGRKVFYPKRVVITQTGDLPTSLALLKEWGECIVACSEKADTDSLSKLSKAGARILTLRAAGSRPSIADLMKQLAELGCLSVLIEGGGEVAASALEERVVDKVIYLYSPKIIGGRDAIPAVGGEGAADVGSAIRLGRVKLHRFGEDFAVEGYILRE